MERVVYAEADMNKYRALRRSQLLVRLLGIESELLATNGRGQPRIKWGTPRDRALRTERAQLLDEMRTRDAEILAHWRAATPARERADLR